jgi:hypothetical protein
MNKHLEKEKEALQLIQHLRDSDIARKGWETKRSKNNEQQTTTVVID